MCGGASMTGLFIILLAFAGMFAVANFGSRLSPNGDKITISKKIKNTLQPYVIYAMS
jgi:hypothetical protein